MKGRRARIAPVVAAVLACAACVAPAPSTGAYQGRAATSTADAMSAARTAVLAVETFQRGNLTRAALEVLLQESEAALGSVASTFASLQPSDTTEADALRAEVGDLLADADDQAQDLRIAARRQDSAGLTAGATALAATADDLESLHEELR